MQFKTGLKLALFFLCCCGGLVGESKAGGVTHMEILSKKGLSEMIADNTHQRGQELRKVLEDTYEKLAASNGLRGAPHGTDVTDVVLPYIPLGTQFAEAEAILRDAGFAVGPRPSLSQASNPNRSKDWYGILASISSFHEKLFYQVSLYVSIIPKAPGEYNDVRRIKATFIVSMP